MSEQSFADLGVSHAVIRRLAQHGITDPFPIQRDVIPDALAGRDVLAKSPTGSGKTLAFGVPLIERITAVVRAPRHSFWRRLVSWPPRSLTTSATSPNREGSESPRSTAASVWASRPRTQRDPHLLVATPGRLEDLLARGTFTLDAVRMLVLDEADRMLDMGFRPAVERIVAQCPAARQTLFFSATLDGEAGRVATQYTRDPAVHERGGAKRRASVDVEHRFVAVQASTGCRCWSPSCAGSETSRSCSCAPSTAPTVSSSGFAATVSRRLRCMATSRSASGSAPSRASGSGDVDTLVATDVAARGTGRRPESHT